ncbi:DUF3225 domain-containing protein [Bifidobacterium sp. MA2]|uniref:DUF3225 domain-containing protein n=1 Tax=Bifidobacterium santillanense TaxID=2809028 RepID=A0ABS5URL4_9BIFI|nr:AtzH-like domain-containing protein [Bifidobacterium santillanense]MBT1173456.1 DUF3225 domain-containing protein [Bifidobacterium santillanense]
MTGSKAAHAVKPAFDNADVLDPALRKAIERYERALMANDTDVLSELFADNPDDIPVVRSDGAGMRVGHTAITAFRAKRGGAPARRLHRRIARRLDADNAVVVSEFDKAAGGRVIQTQVWTRLRDGEAIANGAAAADGVWRIVAAHLTYPAPALDRRVWRVAGDPLVPAAKQGPLTGMGVAVKDLYAVAGQRIGAGNPDFLADSPVCEANADAVDMLRDAGASIVGIAQTDEFAYSLAGANVHYGTPPNPKAPDRISGGSSSGPASAVALGQAAIGLGTDTAGSIRIPSAYQGLWGIRTTHGRISRNGIHPLSDSFDTVGWMTRDAQTLGFAARALMPEREPAGAIEGLAIATELDGLAEHDVREAFEAFRDAVVAKTAAGVDNAGFTPHMLDELLAVFQVVRGYEAWRANGAWISRHWDSPAPEIAERFRHDATIGEDDYRRGLDRLAQARTLVRGIIGRRALLIPSASSVAPFLVNNGDVTAVEHARAQTLRLTSIAGVGGLPAVNIPLETADGLPCGACLVGPAGSDKALIELAKDLVR